MLSCSLLIKRSPYANSKAQAFQPSIEFERLGMENGNDENNYGDWQCNDSIETPQCEHAIEMALAQPLVAAVEVFLHLLRRR